MHEVYFTIGLTLALVVLVIWVFLGDIRATIIPALAIPISLIGSFIILWAMGFSINLLTLLALVLAIGLVVDDAIVVLENVYKRIEKGSPALSSALIGTKQVAFAVIATTLVLVAVFLPVSMIPGNAGGSLPSSHGKLSPRSLLGFRRAFTHPDALLKNPQTTYKRSQTKSGYGMGR